MRPGNPDLNHLCHAPLGWWRRVVGDQTVAAEVDAHRAAGVGQCELQHANIFALLQIRLLPRGRYDQAGYEFLFRLKPYQVKALSPK
jgi:hypothetical protein